MSRCCLPQCLSFHQDKVGTDYSQIFAWDNPVERRSNGKLLCNVLDRLLKGYETKVDEEGVAVEPPLAKKRRGRRAPSKKDDSQTSQPAPDGNRSEIRIGTSQGDCHQEPAYVGHSAGLQDDDAPFLRLWRGAPFGLH